MFNPRLALARLGAQIRAGLIAGIDKLQKSSMTQASRTLSLALHGATAMDQTPGAFGRWMQREKPAGSKLWRKHHRVGDDYGRMHCNVRGY